MKANSVTRRGFVRMAGAGGAMVLLEPLAGVSGRARAQVLRLTHAQPVDALVFLPLYVAQANGYFDQEGIDLNVFTAQQRTIALRAIITGDAFTYCGDPAEPGLARLRGVDVKNIGTLVDRAVLYILGKPGLPKDVKQWKGKSIIAPRPPSSHFSLLQSLLLESGYTQADREGLVWKPSDSASDKDHLRLQPVTFGSQLPALLAGNAELASIDEPDASTAVGQGFDVLFSFPQAIGPFYLSSIAVMNRAIQKQPDLVQRFVNAVTKGCLFGHKYPDKAAEVAEQRYYTAEAKVIAAAAKRLIADGAYPKNMVVSKESYAANFDSLLVKTKHPAAKYPFEQLMDLRFAEAAATKLSAKDV